MVFSRAQFKIGFLRISSQVKNFLLEGICTVLLFQGDLPEVLGYVGVRGPFCMDSDLFGQTDQILAMFD